MLEVGALKAAIMDAVRALVFAEQCVSADYYPEDHIEEVTGEVLLRYEITGQDELGRCVLPTTYGMDADEVIELYLDELGD